MILSRYSLKKYRTSWRRLLTVYINISQVFMSEYIKYNLRVDPIYLFFCKRFFLFLSPTNILLNYKKMTRINKRAFFINFLKFIYIRSSQFFTLPSPISKVITLRKVIIWHYRGSSLTHRGLAADIFSDIRFHRLSYCRRVKSRLVAVWDSYDGIFIRESDR